MADYSEAKHDMDMEKAFRHETREDKIKRLEKLIEKLSSELEQYKIREQIVALEAKIKELKSKVVGL